MCCRLPRTRTVRALREQRASHPLRRRRRHLFTQATASSKHSATDSGSGAPALGLDDPKLMAPGEMASLMGLGTSSPVKQGATSVWVCTSGRRTHQMHWLLLGSRGAAIRYVRIPVDRVFAHLRCGDACGMN